MKIGRVQIRRVQRRNLHVPQRPKDSHKKSWGSLQIVGGQKGFAGAGILCALGAFKSGCGYIALLSDDRTALKSLPELILGEITASAYVVGPGLRNLKAGIFQKILKSAKPLLVDAGGIALLPKYLEKVRARASTVITPHPGELAKLMGTTTTLIQKDRVAALKNAGEKWQITILLKGHKTLVYHDGEIFLIPTGNEGMATAGQGDVLSGIIGALLASGMEVKDATITGAYIHGLAADRIAKRKKLRQGILAHEVAEEVAPLMTEMRRLF